ncbi:putative dynein heavy chain 2 [Paratrimastix pyriformis]|uniref:Dynein heavy chain 2 n=1 Tax=Paratrimastix pyriformis TaxID=342808 RepID=A0ABQ8U0Q9_9EUKA|nr:putative dynein heavy chain 2 [Paratrimastix pyriformis]
MISTAVGTTIDPDADTTLGQLLEMNLERWGPRLTQSLSGPWPSMHSRVPTLGMIDDQRITVQTMLNSPLIAQFEATLAGPPSSEWLQCQRQWIYLRPILPRMTQQRSNEARKFNAVDSAWRRSWPVCMPTACPGRLRLAGKSRIYDNSEGLVVYLEAKRAAFPRFYFLSNEELLDFTDQRPQNVQRHLPKCFEGIRSLKFGEANVIQAMCSAEGESIPFAQVRRLLLPARKCDG